MYIQHLREVLHAQLLRFAHGQILRRRDNVFDFSPVELLAHESAHFVVCWPLDFHVAKGVDFVQKHVENLLLGFAIEVFVPKGNVDSRLKGFVKRLQNPPLVNRCSCKSEYKTYLDSVRR